MPFNIGRDSTYRRRFFTRAIEANSSQSLVAFRQNQCHYNNIKIKLHNKNYLYAGVAACWECGPVLSSHRAFALQCRHGRLTRVIRQSSARFAIGIIRDAPQPARLRIAYATVSGPVLPDLGLRLAPGSIATSIPMRRAESPGDALRIFYVIIALRFVSRGMRYICTTTS